MAYTPTEWETADIVTATRMNALETAVGEMNMSYTPNTWSDGDILTAAKMNALEQAVASGGGGSSDFSTATLTVVNNSDDGIYVYIPWVGGLGLSTVSSVEPTQTKIMNVILYQDFETDGWISDMFGDYFAGTAIATGDVTYDEGGVYVTGDGTITIS